MINDRRLALQAALLATAFLAQFPRSAQTQDVSARAQDVSEILEGHSHFGEAFDDGPRQAAYLMGGTGNVDFPVTTKSPLAQKFINQAVGQTYGFWYVEAERSF